MNRGFLSLLFALILFSGVTTLSAQGIFNYPGMFYAPVPAADAWSRHRDAFDMDLMQPGQFRLDMDLGTSFSTFGSMGNAYNYYLAPNFQYQAGERFRLSGGVVFSNTRMNASFSMPGPEGMMMPGGSMQSMLVYASGQYLLTPKLLVSGTAYKNIVPGANQGLSDNFLMQGMDFQGMSMSFDYQLTKGISLGASFHYDNRPYGFGYTPFQGSRGYLPMPWR